MLIDIENNPDILLLLKTKPLANKPKRGEKPFGKQTAEREQFKKDVIRLKFAGYLNKDIAEYFNISKDAIDTITAEEKEEINKTYTREKLILLLDEVYEIDKIISDIKRDISQLKPSEKALKLKYLQVLLKFQQEREVLLWLKTDKITLTTEEDSMDKLFSFVKQKANESSK